MTAPKVVIHSDIILDYLRPRRSGLPAGSVAGVPVLRVAMLNFFCYTTVFSAVELFERARTASDRRKIEDSLGAMKILGFPTKYARRCADLVRGAKERDVLALLTAGICLESGLPLVTFSEKLFRGIRGLMIIPGSAFRPGLSAEGILQHAGTSLNYRS